MIKIFMLLLLTAFHPISKPVLGSFVNMFPDKNEIPESDQIMMKIMDETSEKLRSKYDFYPCGFGMRGQDKFRGVTIEYQLYKRLKKDEARAILADAVDMLLDNINKNEKIRPELEEYPFTKRNVGITLFIEGDGKEEILHPDICVARWYSKGVYYHTEDPETHFFKEETCEETHDEALELVKQYRASQVAQSERLNKE